MKKLFIVFMTDIVPGCLYTSVDGDPGSGRLGERFVCIGKATCDGVQSDIHERFCAAPGSGSDLGLMLKDELQAAGCTIQGMIICGGEGTMEGDGVIRPCVLE